MTAKEFIDTLTIIGQEYPAAIPKKEIFFLAREFQYMQVSEVVKLLKEENYDHRLGAVSILDWKARNKKTSTSEKKDIYRAYIDNHKWIDDWGMVDRAAPYVVGGYLFDKDKKELYELAKSRNPMERRTAIVSTYYLLEKMKLKTPLALQKFLEMTPTNMFKKLWEAG
jgi:3-methyladenine DNA glycosylase AlkD